MYKNPYTKVIVNVIERTENNDTKWVFMVM